MEKEKIIQVIEQALNSGYYNSNEEFIEALNGLLELYKSLENK